MGEFNLDDFTSLEELVARARNIIWDSMPCAREALSALEEKSREDEVNISLYGYILEVLTEVLDPAVENGMWDVVKAFYELCEALLGLDSSMLEETIEDLVVKDLAGYRPELMRWAGPRLRNMVEAY
ncbi:hypothetical protein GCM10010149_80030 [Nonomuraea roseoviolacea subsp. roseoviolacea]|uniref:hypothetical protein n=1 Tax=Nonomuraea roseoviolacea TaxID=103837 RepID=UPI0031E3E2D7